MDMTITSVISLIIWGNLAVLLISIMFSSSKIFNSMNCNCMFFLLLITLLRFLWPFEFAVISRNIESHKILPPIMDLIRFTSISIVGKEIYVYEFLLTAWGIVSVILLFKLVYQYICFKNKLKVLLTNDKCIQVNSVLFPIQAEKVKVYKCGYISGPIISGVSHPVILLPDFPFSEKELSLVLQHELQHYQCKDVLFKVLIEVFCILYWWNPLIYLLKKKMLFLLEVRADTFVCKNFSEMERMEYLECLKSAYQYQTSFYKFDLGFAAGKSGNNIIQRAEYLVENRYQKKVMFFSSGAIILLLCVSILFIFESAPPVPDEIVATTFTLSENSYIILTEEDTYELYDNDMYIGEIEYPNLEPMLDLPIYYIKEKGVVIRE